MHTDRRLFSPFTLCGKTRTSQRAQNSTIMVAGGSETCVPHAASRNAGREQPWKRSGCDTRVAVELVQQASRGFLPRGLLLNLRWLCSGSETCVILAVLGNESCRRLKLTTGPEPVQKVHPREAMSPCEVARSLQDPSEMSHDVITALRDRTSRARAVGGSASTS